MARTQNLSAGDIIPQMGFQPTQNQNGGWRAVRSYYMLADTWESASTQIRFEKGSPITTADGTVDSIYSFLSVESKTASYEDSGTVLLTVNYTGAASAQYGGDGGTELDLTALPTYRLDGRLREVSITEHPKFKLLGDGERASLTDLIDGLVSYLPVDVPALSLTAGIHLNFEDGTQERAPEYRQITSEDGLSFATKISAGIVTYLAPTYTWTETTQGETGMTSAQLNSLGKVTTPRGNPPEAGGTRDWLLTSAHQEQSGSLYQTNIEWTLSEQNGWDSFLYTE